MYLLDSDTLTSLFANQSNVVARVKQASPHSLFISAIAVQESLKGALQLVSAIHGNPPAQIASKYDLMLRIVRHTNSYQILPYDENSESIFRALPNSVRQAHPQDCRHAAVALSNGLIMVTRNLRHFSKIGGLTIENWVDS